MSKELVNAYDQKIELTKEQMSCIDSVDTIGQKALMIKGVAGSGKSVVLMGAALGLLQKNIENISNFVSIFTYQNTLVSSTKEFLLKNGFDENSVNVCTINSYIKLIYEKMVADGKAPKRKYPFNDKKGEEKKQEIVKEAYKLFQDKYGRHRFLNLEPSFWLEEFEWMKQLNVWTDDIEYYLKLKRVGRGNTVRMSSKERIDAFRLFELYCGCLDKKGLADWEDQTLFIIRHARDISEEFKYEHVLIDEAQDLTTAQMLAAMLLFKKNMVVAMDINQKIHDRYWTPKSIGIDATTKKLTKTMRTTNQIDALAESVRSKNDIYFSSDERNIRAIPETEGEIPTLVHLTDSAAEQKYVVNLVKKVITEKSNWTVGIIAAKNIQTKMFSEWLASAGIKYELVSKDSTYSVGKPGVKIVSAYGAKGLEFDYVIIPMFAEGYFPFNYIPSDEDEFERYIIKMRNLVYVSMTRAKKLLTITFYGNKGSKFIADMDSKLYKFVGEPVSIRGFEVKRKIKVDEEALDESVLSKKQALSTEKGADLKSYLIEKGYEVIDKRDSNGNLWIIGDKSIEGIIKETKSKYGALWLFSPTGGIVTKRRPAWYTKSKK